MKYNRLLISLFLIVFWYLLDFSYRNSISQNFAYDGFSVDFRYDAFYVFLFFALIIIILINRIKNVFLYQLTIVSIMLVFLPNSILYYSFHYNFYILLSSFLWIVIPLMIGPPKRSFKFFPEIESRDLPKVLLALSIVLTIPFLFTFGIPTSLNSLLLQDIYDVREAAGEQANIFTSYVSSPLAKVLVPTTIIISIMERKWQILILAVLLQLYLFLINPHKSVLAFLIIALFFSLFNNPNYQIKYFLLCMCLIIALGTYLINYHGFPFLESYMSRRSYFVPALLNNAYFEVFKDEKLFLSYSKINPFIEYEHDINPTHYVGIQYFGKDMGANTGIIGSGYMDFGYVGVLINLLIYSKIVVYISGLNYNFKFFGLMLIMVITLNSSSLLTSVFTHGMLFLFLVLNELTLKNKQNES